MKKFLATISTAIAVSQFAVTKSFAALAPPPVVGGITTSDDIKSIIIDVLIRVLDFVTLLAVIFIIVAGIRLIVSAGEEGEKDKAKKTIIYVCVGLVVILFARVIVTFFSTLA